ncbi:sensor histidine kinase [Anatilimnocola floriformis]|uniref:sensor histidine kinase n=1 Tax=Anatilimnocola floriformis TaxID=2948575 RepID=UPI0020C31E0D|nr:sensor histidine kinase [Anatilimnocola floriformis]
MSAEESLESLRAECAALRAEHELLLRERALLHRSLELHERDRQLLAFEIHDGVVQDMAGAAMLLESAARQATFENPAAAANLEKGIRTLRDSVAEARRLIRGLIPVVLDQAGFIASLQKLVRRFEEDHGLQVSLTTNVQLRHLAPAFEMIILRIVQEALNNVSRHSGASAAKVCVEQSGQQLLLTIADDGSGFDPTQVKSTRYGLTGMKERARLIGGVTQIDSQPGRGTRVQVTLPLAEALVDEH